MVVQYTSFTSYSHKYIRFAGNISGPVALQYILQKKTLKRTAPRVKQAAC